jgi:hypothetical protein
MTDPALLFERLQGERRSAGAKHYHVGPAHAQLVHCCRVIGGAGKRWSCLPRLRWGEAFTR